MRDEERHGRRGHCHGPRLFGDVSSLPVRLRRYRRRKCVAGNAFRPGDVHTHKGLTVERQY